MKVTPLDEKSSTKPKLKDDISLTSIQLGVWHIILPKDLPFNFQKQWNDFYSTIPIIRRLISDIYNVAPQYFGLFISAKAWGAMETALLMYLSTRILRIVEVGIIEGKPDVIAIVWAIVARLVCAMLARYLEWLSLHSETILSGRVIRQFGTHIMRARVQMDLPTSQEPSIKDEANAKHAWWDILRIMEYLTSILSMLSQLLLVVHESNNVGGPIFALLCIVKPLASILVGRALWNKAFIANAANPHYQRKYALEKLASEEYKQDVLSGNLGEYIMQEYSNACDKLGDDSDDHPVNLYSMMPSPIWDIMKELLADLPMMYCAFVVIMNPTKFSLASIAVLNQSASWLSYSFGSLLRSAEDFRKDVNSIRMLYATADLKNLIKDGELPYSSSSELGMGFELQNVSFAYPGSKMTTNALNGISVTIKPGQLVVIVGSNGSGKSTMIKLLSRLYEPNSGTILVDGRPVEQYRIADLRQATAILSQDNRIYPLSLAENIGLGYSGMAADQDAIRAAAEQGGASEFISKFSEGLATILDPFRYIIQRNFRDVPDHPLHEELKKLEKKLEISGGERQRVVAARTFMRFRSGKVKLVAVDEPTSALDAEGESKLFDNLIKAREGKTMIFVTHKFGHLTRHADMIICMKDGAIVEQGTHDDLIKIRGDYAKLYEIQAKAFAVDSAQHCQCARILTPTCH